MDAPGPDESMQEQPTPMNAAEESIIVNAPVAQVYEQWLRFEDLAKFIKAFRNVKRIDDTHFSFTSVVDGKELDSVIEVVRQIPERRIAWRTISERVGLGVVSFEPRSDDTTEVTLKLRSVFDPSMSAQNAGDYLLNFKRLIEQEP